MRSNCWVVFGIALLAPALWSLSAAEPDHTLPQELQ